MLKQFDKNDIDIIMKIWKDNNHRFQGFIDDNYWISNYSDVKNSFLTNKVYTYTESSRILAYVAFDEKNNELLNIQVMPEILREGIGKILIEKIKQSTNTMHVKIYEKNINATLFFRAMGFIKKSEEIDDSTKEKVYTMQWNKGNELNKTFIYFDDSISNTIIEKYNKLNKLQFYNIHTFKEKSDNIYIVNIEDELQFENGQCIIKDYITLRNKLNTVMKNNNIIIYFDCKNDYSYLFSIIKDIAKIKGTNLRIIMHKPFIVEGGKKAKLYENVKQEFSEYELIDIDYESIGENINITFKEAFDMRDEELLKTICNEA